MPRHAPRYIFQRWLVASFSVVLLLKKLIYMFINPESACLLLDLDIPCTNTRRWNIVFNMITVS